MSSAKPHRLAGIAAVALLPLLWVHPLAAEGGVTYRDAAADGGAGIDYRRVPSPSKEIFDALRRDPEFDLSRVSEMPMKAWGAPGVAILDYDRDGDLDLYVTNGPGAANSLYSNQLSETGNLAFVDVAEAAGVGAAEQDSTGVCYGDLDNDGDHDLLVLSHSSADRLFENLGQPPSGGDGSVTFRDITEESGIAAGGVRVSSGCSMGDVNGDGLLDIAVANTYENWDDYRGIDTEPFALNQHNQLFVNTGGNVFVDVSATSGVEQLGGFAPEHAGSAGLTWAIALVDVDLDGDVDLMNADDQASIPEADLFLGGIDRGMLHLLVNDGKGQFTDVIVQAGLDVPGAWMGLSYGDFNCDGRLDFFATNFGDYVPFAIQEPGRRPSRWFLGEPGGTFSDPGVGDLATTPFGWGNAVADYDNDGDLDVIYHGGLDVGLGVEATNQGVILRNPGCSTVFPPPTDGVALVPDLDALAGSTDHGRRTVHGMAVGDLDGNGFVDVVSVSNFNLPEDVPLDNHAPIGSPFDAEARFHLSFDLDRLTGTAEWTGFEFVGGTLAVELAKGDDTNDNGAVRVRTLGTVGITSRGRANRDGIGAVVRFWSETTPQPGMLLPVLGGSSYASQNELTVHFGLGAAGSGHVEVLWPGGGKNRLYNVRAGERVVLPEIPCDFEDSDLTFRQYLACVLSSLEELADETGLSSRERARLLESAVRARREAQDDACSVTGEFKRQNPLRRKDLLRRGEPAADALAKGTGSGITFHDIAAGDAAGITFRRQPSASKAIFDAIKLDPPYSPDKRIATPMKAWGAPGVALFDHDGDGDLDIYVTNGPGAANSLYSNQLSETGSATFVDVGEAAGVDAFDQDSTGVCFGDVDNDGDADLLVLSHNSPNRLFENQGVGADGRVTFADISDASGLAAGPVRASSGCSMGDADGDGLLDITIGNSYDNWDHSEGLNLLLFAANQHNELWRNTGGNVFVDVAAAAGVEELAGFPAENAGAAGLTWAVAMVDYDLDGDVDIFNLDDQSGFPTAQEGGVDRGIIHVLDNDGSGQFVDRNPGILGSTKPGAWMGVTFGDFNCDGALDFFGSNFGDFNPFVPQPPGRRASRWFLGTGDGRFTDPGVGNLVTTPFGWGTSAVDYDNDGDLDVIYHGGLDIGVAIEAANNGVVLSNPGCSALFEADFEALAGSTDDAQRTDHGRRTIHGMAVGDLDQDGFMDIVSVSNFNIPEEVELTPVPALGSPFDPFARVHFNFLPEPRTEELVWVGSTFTNGTLSVELSDGGSGHGAVEVRTLGTVGLARGSRVNRDGIGAVVRFWSRAVPPPGVMLPVMGGSSYASQDQLAVHFGLGQESRGIVDVLWPGGVRNRLYNVKAGSRIVFPEIPCSFADPDQSLDDYLVCLLDAFDDLGESGALRRGERTRYLMSALRARNTARGLVCTRSDRDSIR